MKVRVKVRDKKAIDLTEQEVEEIQEELEEEYANTMVILKFTDRYYRDEVKKYGKEYNQLRSMETTIWGLEETLERDLDIYPDFFYSGNAASDYLAGPMPEDVAEEVANAVKSHLGNHIKVETEKIK